MDVRVNNCGIVADARIPKDVAIVIGDFKQDASHDIKLSSGVGSFSSSRSADGITKVDLSGETPGDEKNLDETLPKVAELLDVNGDMLLNSTINDKKLKQNSRRGNRCTHVITMPMKVIENFVTENKKVIFRFLTVVFIIWNFSWLVIAAVKDWNRCLPFFIIICLVVVFRLYFVVRNHFGPSIVQFLHPCTSYIGRHSNHCKFVMLFIAIAGFIAWIILDTAHRPHQVISLVGYFVFLFMLFLCSKMPENVVWRPIIWGCSLQICLGLLILRTSVGFSIFDYLGKIVQIFLTFVEDGCKFMFGPVFKEHYFAFAVLPIIIYFSAFISILYHLGAMQWVISKVAWLMQISLQTSATESTVAAGNIFVGLTESPLLIRPYIKDLTTSELHAVMSTGFGTIAGSVLGAYLGFGIKAVYVITACVMAAPCALAVSKLLYPETQIPKFKSSDRLLVEASGHHNIIEAAFVGASQAIPLVLNIGANLIAFIALLASVNAFLGWYGSLVDIENLSFEYLCSYVFMPFSYLMGIEWMDCFKCAELIGTKIFLNEFIAYEKLSVLIHNKNSFVPRFNETSGELNWISDRSEAIITYALCGFANLGAVGVALGGLGSMCPERRSEMAKIVLRALLGGIFVSFLNACIAGFFYYPPPIDCTAVLSKSFNFSDVQYAFQCCSGLVAKNLTQYRSACCNYTWPYGRPEMDGC